MFENAKWEVIVHTCDLKCIKGKQDENNESERRAREQHDGGEEREHTQ